MNATVNAFPPLHALNSSRGWFVALIALLHLGFFWALTTGHTVYIWKPPPQGPITAIPLEPVVPPKPVVPPQPPSGLTSHVVDPIPLPPEVDYRDTIVDTAPQVPARPEAFPEGPGSAVPMPLIVEPALDPRYPFTEPEYPVSEIRQGHEGTVLLSLQILPNGRVGDVRIEQSSGYLKLDDSAAKEARKWRMKPGTSDGSAMAMWKKVPIKFQLKN
jgi:periplasmic protein TonB